MKEAIQAAARLLLGVLLIVWGLRLLMRAGDILERLLAR